MQRLRKWTLRNDDEEKTKKKKREKNNIQGQQPKSTGDQSKKYESKIKR